MTKQLPKLDWFDLKKYDATSQFDVIDWYYFMNKRYFLKNLLAEKIESSTPSAIIKEEIRNLLLSQGIKMLKESPLFRDDTDIDLAVVASVRDAYVSDLYSMEFDPQDIERIQSNDDSARGGLLLRDYKLKYSDSDEEVSIDELLSISPLNDVVVEKYLLPPGVSDKAMLSIDILAPDEQLIEDFTNWLNGYRARTLLVSDAKKYSEPVMKSWSKIQLLAYLDIKLVSKHEDIRLTNEQIVGLLYPTPDDKTDIRTIKKYEKLLMGDWGMKALRKQAESFKREKLITILLHQRKPALKQAISSHKTINKVYDKK